MTVTVRFAPSPTGFLHIGGARTALFNWLFARHHGGDVSGCASRTPTASARPTAATAAIIDGLDWLGLEWDGEVVHQFAGAAHHAEIARQLLAAGRAYRCYCTPDELEAMREQARAEKRSVRYDGTWRDRDPAEAPPGVAAGDPPEGAAADGATTIRDHVLGEVTVGNEELDDLIILRSDGTPTYNFSVVVDDHDMGITHVIRGNEHFRNAFRQMQIYRALDWPVPEFAHIPLIHGSDGAKMSKRHGALGVEAYRDMGYLPEALRNYLLRLGWSHGDDEIISTEAGDRLVRPRRHRPRPGAVRFCQARQRQRALHPRGRRRAARRAGRGAARSQSSASRCPDADRDRLRRSDAGAEAARQDARRTRRKCSVSMSRRGRSSRADDAAEAVDCRGAPCSLGELTRPGSAADWRRPRLEQRSPRDFADGEGVKLGAVAQPLRAALTGSLASPGIFEVMEVLGRDETLARIRRCCRIEMISQVRYCVAILRTAFDNGRRRLILPKCRFGNWACGRSNTRCIHGRQQHEGGRAAAR